jgi:hypothetical protein
MLYIMIFLIAIVGLLIIVLCISVLPYLCNYNESILDKVLFFWRGMPKKLPRKYDHIFNSKEYVFNYKDDRIEFIDKNQTMFMKRPDYIRINGSLYTDKRVTLAFIEFDEHKKHFNKTMY